MSRGFQQDEAGEWVPFDDDLPSGMICQDCGERHFYDFLDKPEPHEGSGLCWSCWAHRHINQQIRSE